MKLVILYGPPGVGKLTVAKELSKLTGFGLFHSHLTIAAIVPILSFEHPLWSKTVNNMRLDLIEIAGKVKAPGLIFTFVYGGKKDMPFIAEMFRRIKKHNGMVCLVRLHCHHSVYIKRVRSPSRKSMGKICTLKKLKSLSKKWDLDEAIPYRKSLEIDNTHVSAKQCAKHIQNHFRLFQK